MLPWLQLGAGLAIVAAVGIGFHSYNSAIEKAAVSRQKIQSLEADVAAAAVREREAEAERARIQAMLDEADELAKKEAARVAAERAKREESEKRLRELEQSDPAAREWLNTPVPDGVRRERRLRNAAPGNPDGVRGEGSVQGTDRPAQRNPSSAPIRREEPRPARGERLAAGKLEYVQLGQAGHFETHRKDPEMKTVALMFAALILNAAIPDAAAQQPTPPVTLQAAETNFYDAMTAIAGAGADAETKRLAIFAATIARVQEKGGSAVPAAQPQQVIMPKQGRSFWDVVVEVGDRVFSGVERVTPAVLAYAGQRQATKASVSMAEINRDVSIAQSNNFLQLGQAGINGTAQTAQAAVAALGGLTPSNVYTVSGNANFGPGAFTLTTSTSTNSGNTTRTCTGGSAGNSGGTAGGAGGAGGAAGC